MVLWLACLIILGSCCDEFVTVLKIHLLMIDHKIFGIVILSFIELYDTCKLLYLGPGDIKLTKPTPG